MCPEVNQHCQHNRDNHCDSVHGYYLATCHFHPAQTTGISLCLANTFDPIVYHFVFVIHTDVACSHIESHVHVVGDGCRAATRVATFIFAHVHVYSKNQTVRSKILNVSTLADQYESSIRYY